MTKKRHAKPRITYIDHIDLTLTKLGAVTAPMPVPPGKISLRSKLNAAAMLTGALVIVTLYIGIPLVAAVHRMLFPLIQDITVTLAIIVETALLMMYIIMKTDGR